MSTAYVIHSIYGGIGILINLIMIIFAIIWIYQGILKGLNQKYSEKWYQKSWKISLALLCVTILQVATRNIVLSLLPPLSQ